MIKHITLSLFFFVFVGMITFGIAGNHLYLADDQVIELSRISDCHQEETHKAILASGEINIHRSKAIQKRCQEREALEQRAKENQHRLRSLNLDDQ